MKSEILRFNANEPVLLALKFPTGLDVTGKFGPEVMFTLTDGRVIYVSLETAAKIRALDPAAGEFFWIEKRKAGGRVSWEVSMENTAISAAAANVRVMPEARPAAAEPVQGTGTHGPVPLRAPAPALVARKQTYGEAMEGFLVMAGRAARSAEVTLCREGANVRFTSDNVTRLALAAFAAAEARGLLAPEAK